MAAYRSTAGVPALALDYDERQIDGWDYDIGAQQLRADTAGDESSLVELIAAWGLTPDQFCYPWDTADPR